MKNQPTKRLFLNKVGHKALLALSLIALASCGQKDNKVSGNVGGGYNNSGPQSGTQYNTPNLGSGNANQFQQIKASFPCRQGQRLQQDVTFHTQGFNHGGSRTNVIGPYQPGPIGGTVSQIYVGVSVWNDIMMVSRVGSGSQVQGYNVTLSMCSYQANGVPLIDNSRPLTNFQSQSAIIIDSDVHCGFGSVDSAMNTILTSGGIQYQQNGFPISLQPFQIYTTFYKPSCNGQY